MPAEPTPKPLSPRAATVLGSLCVAMGLFIVLLAAGVIPADEKSFHAPRWVVSAGGLMFVLAGAALATTSAPGAPEAAGQTTWRSFVLGGAIVVFMALILNWIAFGPGERRFSGGIALPFVAVFGSGGEWTGRVVFGIGAVLVDVFLVLVIARGLRDLLGRSLEPRRSLGERPEGPQQ